MTIARNRGTGRLGGVRSLIFGSTLAPRPLRPTQQKDTLRPRNVFTPGGSVGRARTAALTLPTADELLSQSSSRPGRKKND